MNQARPSRMAGFCNRGGKNVSEQSLKNPQKKMHDRLKLRRN